MRKSTVRPMNSLRRIPKIITCRSNRIGMAYAIASTASVTCKENTAASGGAMEARLVTSSVFVASKM